MNEHIAKAKSAMINAARELQRAHAETDHLIDGYLRMAEQRDAMLAALKTALETWGDDAMYPLTTAKVKAAIAKAEGGHE